MMTKETSTEGRERNHDRKRDEFWCERGCVCLFVRVCMGVCVHECVCVCA